MIRGTTPVHTFSIPLAPGQISEIYVTYEQANQIVLEKSTTDFSPNADGTLSVHLTQEDTLAFTPSDGSRNKVLVQLRILTTGGEALASEIMKLDVGDILKDGVIEGVVE